MVQKDGCVFYESRTCHVRQYLKLNPEVVADEQVIEGEAPDIQRAYTRRGTQKAELLYRFCCICPHLKTGS